MTPTSEEVAQQLQLVRERYVSQLPDKLALLRQVFGDRNDEAAMQTLRFVAHGLAGSGATFGFPRLSDSARQLEAMLTAALDANRLLDDSERKAAARLLDALDQAAFNPTAEHALPATPMIVLPRRARKLIYLVDDDTESATELALQLCHFGYRVRTFATPAQLSEAVTDPAPAAVLMDVMFPDGDLAGTDAIAELVMSHRLNAPVVFISVRGDLPARLGAARAGCAAYIEKPVDVPALVTTLDHLTPTVKTAPDRVLVVDDSPQLAEHYACILQSAGMHAYIVTDPTRILPSLFEFGPDLILMDMYLPGCTGAELASVIRQFENYIFVPIVFLSTERDTTKQLAAIKLGGDDFLTKPITPEHLVSAVRARVDRHRAIRSLLVRDGLTGALNHSATKERLATEIARATRERQPLCFAMIDMDRFKTINDEHGHAAGDRVLKTLTDLLKQQLRKSDVVGRLGGEEFGVILPNMQATAAARRMDEMREAFSGVRLQASGHAFTTTFSCGVAKYRAGISVDDLLMEADGALYVAKTAGRNRVVLASSPTVVRRQNP